MHWFRLVWPRVGGGKVNRDRELGSREKDLQPTPIQTHNSVAINLYPVQPTIPPPLSPAFTRFPRFAFAFRVHVLIFFSRAGGVWAWRWCGVAVGRKRGGRGGGGKAGRLPDFCRFSFSCFNAEKRHTYAHAHTRAHTHTHGEREREQHMAHRPRPFT